MIYDDLKLSDVEGWLLPPEAEWLYERAKAARTIVEIGCFFGRSTCAILAGCKRVSVVDTFDGRTTSRAGEFTQKQMLEGLIKNVETRGLSQPEVFVGASDEGARTFFPDASIDLLFIDGDHSEAGVATDLRVWASAVKSGGIVCGHDYDDADRPGLMNAVRAYCGGEPERGAGSIWWRRV